MGWRNTFSRLLWRNVSLKMFPNKLIPAYLVPDRFWGFRWTGRLGSWLGSQFSSAAFLLVVYQCISFYSMQWIVCHDILAGVPHGIVNACYSGIVPQFFPHVIRKNNSLLAVRSKTSTAVINISLNTHTPFLYNRLYRKSVWYCFVAFGYQVYLRYCRIFATAKIHDGTSKAPPV